MEQIFLTAAVLLLPMLCTTAGAAGVFLLRKTGGPAGSCTGRVGQCSPALADEPCSRVHGLRDGTGDDPGSRGGRRTGGGHQRGGRVCPDDGAGCCPIKYSVTKKGDRVVRSPFLSVSVLLVFRPAGYPAVQSCTAGSALPPAPFWRAGAAGPAR